MAAKILKFGSITEDELGDLVFQDFHVDAAHQYATNEEAILRLVIDRLTDELTQVMLKARQP